MKQRTVEVGDLLGIPVQIVGHDGQIVHVTAERLQVVVLVVLLSGGDGCGEQQAGTHCVELSSELGGHRVQVFRVFRTAGNQAAVDRILPINVDPVEDSRCVNA